MNFLLTFFAWLLWQWGEFSIAKNVYDDKDELFDVMHYASKKWDDWIGSLICAAVLLLIGYMGLGLELVRIIDAEHPPQWSDLYYAGSGIFWELFLGAIRKFKAK